MALLLLMTLPLKAQVNPNDSIPSGQDSIKISGGKNSIKNVSSIFSDSTENDTALTIAGGKAIIKNIDGATENENLGPVRIDDSQPGIAKETKNRKTFYDPKIAVRRSLIIPGWGQLYNDRWWKVPIIYGGFAAFGVFIVQNNSEYNRYDAVVKCKADALTSCDPYPNYDIATIISFREYHRRYRDLNIIFATLWYTLNAVEAYVDAHLKGFNVSDDLSLHVNPNLSIDPFRRKNLYMGASISLRLR